MTLPSDLLARFQDALRRAREAQIAQWESSSRLVGQPRVLETLARLAAAVRSSSLDPPVCKALLAALRDGRAARIQDLDGARLKELTGLPATKAVRALCVFFHLVATPGPAAAPPPEQIEAFLRANRNPYDLLLDAEAASLLDLGAGDLSFADELLSQYGPRLRARQKTLTLHCVDRLRPGSRLGGRLHADQDRLRKLQRAGKSLAFRFWGNQDMFALANVKGLLPRYTLVTCHGPATPTFAYEPSRVSAPVIEAHLRKTKGEFRPVRVEGEPALEVLHAGRALLFPPWKFEIRGPLALLDLMARRGLAIVLGAVDSEVFWEILAQLVDEDRVRPRDVVFTPANVPEVFGPLYTALSSLPIGKAMPLDQVAPLRRTIPRVSADHGPPGPTYRFRYVEVRRGATFDGLPSSQTARLFKDMPEETPPWMLTLVPDDADI